MNPYQTRKNKIGAGGIKSEKQVARRLAGRQTPASGAMEGAKGDIVLPEFLMEAKSTTADSLGVKFEWLAKITREALAVGKKPALSMSFVTGSGAAVDGGTWVAVPENVFKAMMEELENASSKG